MTRQEAVTKLIKTDTLSTGMLTPLGLSFDFFLTYAQKDKETQKRFNEMFIRYQREQYNCKIEG